MFLDKITYHGEELMEPLLRWLRFGSGRKYYFGHRRIFDFGCGPKHRFAGYLASHKISYSDYTGFDPLIKKPLRSKGLVVSNIMNDVRGKYDLVTMFAVLEHVTYPDFDFSFLKKHTHTGSILVITTPSHFGKLFLEKIFYPLGLVSKREIEEHKHYYSKPEIRRVFEKYGFKVINIKYLMFGLNTLAVMRRV